MVTYKQINTKYIESVELSTWDGYHTVLITANGREYRRMFRTIEAAQKHITKIESKISKKYIVC